MEKSKLTVKPESNFGRQIIKNLPFAQWTRIETRHGGKNYYIVQDTRSKVIKLYDGDKGRELKEQGWNYSGHSLILPPPTNCNDLQSFLFP